jgi:hypothetical protein
MNFGILIFNDVEELDFLGAWENGRDVEQAFQNPGPIICAKGS